MGDTRGIEHQSTVALTDQHTACPLRLHLQTTRLGIELYRIQPGGNDGIGLDANHICKDGRTAHGAAFDRALCDQGHVTTVCTADVDHGDVGIGDTDSTRTRFGAGAQANVVAVAAAQCLNAGRHDSALGNHADSPIGHLHRLQVQVAGIDQTDVARTRQGQADAGELGIEHQTVVCARRQAGGLNQTPALRDTSLSRAELDISAGMAGRQQGTAQADGATIDAGGNFDLGAASGAGAAADHYAGVCGCGEAAVLAGGFGCIAGTDPHRIGSHHGGLEQRATVGL